MRGSGDVNDMLTSIKDLRCCGGMTLYGGEGNDDGRDCGGGDTGLFKIKLKMVCFAESNRTSMDARGCELQVGLIGGPIGPTVTKIFLFDRWGADRATSLKKVWGGGG